MALSGYDLSELRSSSGRFTFVPFPGKTGQFIKGNSNVMVFLPIPIYNDKKYGYKRNQLKKKGETKSYSARSLG